MRNGDKTFEQIGYERLRDQAMLSARVILALSAGVDPVASVVLAHEAEILERAAGVLR